MKKILSSTIVLTLLFALVLPALTFAHSGRTDSSGGHNCSEKSKSKGLCTGYHYHNGGSSSSSGSSTAKSETTTSKTKVKIISNQYAPFPYCKKVKDVYKSSDDSYIYYERVWDCNRYTENGTVYTTLDLSLYVDDAYQSLQQKFISINNASYIYIRDFNKAFGYSIELDKSKNVLLKTEESTITIYTESRKIYLNGKYTGFNAVKAEGNYYIPFRAAVKWAQGTIESIDSTAVYLTKK
ncbi:MAG: YHYH domain-containing protein [Candidatus Pristimantibacillus sp.]